MWKVWGWSGWSLCFSPLFSFFLKLHRPIFGHNYGTIAANTPIPRIGATKKRSLAVFHQGFNQSPGTLVDALDLFILWDHVGTRQYFLWSGKGLLHSFQLASRPRTLPISGFVSKWSLQFLAEKMRFPKNMGWMGWWRFESGFQVSKISKM